MYCYNDMASRAYGNVDKREYMEDGGAVDSYCINYVNLCNYHVRGYVVGLCACFVFLALPFWILFGVYAAQNADARSCALTYDANNVVTSQQAHDWMHGDSWGFAKLEYNAKQKTCICETSETGPSSFPVWVAPGDLVLLQQANLVQTLPAGFATSYENIFTPISSIKVCLTQKQLTYLWGNDQNATTVGGLKCHTAPNDDVTQTGIATGAGGVLMCTRSVFMDNEMNSQTIKTFTAANIQDTSNNQPVPPTCASGTTTPSNKRFERADTILRDVALIGMDLLFFATPSSEHYTRYSSGPGFDRDTSLDLQNGLVFSVAFDKFVRYEQMHSKTHRDGYCENKITTCPTACPTGTKKRLFSFYKHFPARVICGYHCIRN